jgi:hypothetical protein
VIVPSLRQRLTETPAWVVDVAVALGTAVANGLWIEIATERGARGPDALAHGLSLAMAALLLVRRRWPPLVPRENRRE